MQAETHFQDTSAAIERQESVAATPRPLKGKQSNVSKQSRPYIALKFVECIFAIVLVIVGRNTWPAVLARGNLHLALQPLVAGATFIVYCPLMLLGFAINRCTPPIVMLAMAVLGAVHFLFEAATCGSFWADLARLTLAQPPNLPPGPDLEAVARLLEAVGADSDPRFAADSLLLQCMIASAAAAAFFADVFLTTKYALLRRQPYNSLPPLL